MGSFEVVCEGASSMREKPPEIKGNITTKQ
jgi:hypothetical protein